MSRGRHPGEPLRFHGGGKEQGRDAARYILGHLNPGDRFGVVPSTGATALTEGLQRVTPARIAAAVGELLADGSTNIHDALSRPWSGWGAPGAPLT